MKTIYFISLILAFTLALPGASHARGYGSDKVSVKAGFEHNFQSRIRGSDARVSSSRYGIESSYSHFTLAYDYSEYSWDKARDSDISTGGQTPWKGLHRVSLRARKNFFLSQEWMFNLGGAASSYFEREMSESFSFRADFSFVRLFESGWSTGFGAGGVYHPVESRLLPLIVIGYAPTGDMGFSARIGFPETSLRYGLSESLAARTYLRYTARIYRLKNNSPVSRKGYFREQGFKLGAELEVKPVQPLSVTIGPYYLMDRKWEIYNRNKSRVHREKLKGGPGMIISLSWKF